MKAELQAITPSGKPVKVIVTGGLASLLETGIEGIDHVDKLLTLEGLQLVFEKNR
jgi:type III pantothenate kinase